MSDTSAFGFGQFVPGFDFLQNLSKTAAQAQPAAAAGMPGMASWVAPTLSIEEIDKRIQELKSVLFWLEQNTTALKATIQAMEVQKMTLTTLQSMNVNMADLAKAFTAKPPTPEAAPAAAAANAAAKPRTSLFTPKPAPQAEAETAPATPQASASSADATAQAAADLSADKADSGSVNEAAKPAVDPMQWWGALTQQFQGIAAAALKDVAGEAMKAGMAAQAASSAKAPAARKSASTKTTRAKPAARGAAVKRQGAKVAPAKAARTASQPAARQVTKK
ncbi:PhaM family polyhydroxyalkanoate granule multifunctional regulatory protein [Limnohabitans sp. Hippo3]|uniref:PhaM family polyhydroxyalkanoate granule multifunctional regulatory protein n=1 Tax=Limnohabitans sp. Hippo3 TaxID=1597956 RepID=UPI000D35D7FB|nr:PhaM family polyhydroxyalkanoate granule multifunctional regulatory protein [Limnohabitans sp. Hippo3]PUE38619.1 hypothetical protein B9Z34_11545 [Limnohabitans sp. Hippo3]